MILRFAGLLLACFLLTACPGSKKKVIAVVPIGTSHLFWQSVQAGAIAAGRDLDVEVASGGDGARLHALPKQVRSAFRDDGDHLLLGSRACGEQKAGEEEAGKAENHHLRVYRHAREDRTGSI